MTYDQAVRRAQVTAWILAIIAVGAFLAASCHRVDDGSDALCLGVTTEHGLCVEWRKRR